MRDDNDKIAHIFTVRFGWNTLDIGLGYGTALTVGGLLGEVRASPDLRQFPFAKFNNTSNSS
jgi:hypothetical protein